MARALAPVFLDKFKEGGMYHVLLDVVRNDMDLQFEIRVNNEVMIYFEKCLLLTIGYRKNQDDKITMLAGKYRSNRKDKLRLNTMLQTPADLSDRGKVESYLEEAKALVKNYKKHDEFIVQQEFKRRHSSFDDDYMAIDMEWMPKQGDLPLVERINKNTCIDLVLISNHVNAEGFNDIYLAEVKYGLGAVDGNSGMEDHILKSRSIIGNTYASQALVTDVTHLVRQKKALGLFDGEPIKYNYPARPKMMFVLAYRTEAERQNLQNRIDRLVAEYGPINVEYMHFDGGDDGIEYQVGGGSNFMSSNNDSAFKAACRMHQAWFREKVLRLPMGENVRTHRAVGESEEDFLRRRKSYSDITHLTDEDAMRLMNFVPAFRDEIKAALCDRYGKIPVRHDLMNDMLCSECIPWNFFVPMMVDREAAVQVLRLMTRRNDIEQIVDFRIEYNPLTLADGTAFDAYFGYRTAGGESGIIGIETKYTEEGYLVHGKEKSWIDSPDSPYRLTMRECGCFNSDDSAPFDCPDFIQIWRNHLLAASMYVKGQARYFDSVTIYPKGNCHFHSRGKSRGALERYEDFLTEAGKSTFHHFTFDVFVKLLGVFYRGERFSDWLEYLRKRYVPADVGPGK